MLENNGSIGKTPMKPIIYFQTWRVGKLFCGVKFLVGIYMIYFFWKITVFGTQVFSYNLTYRLLSTGITFFIIGNCLNFISFGYAAQVGRNYFSPFHNLSIFILKKHPPL